MRRILLLLTLSGALLGQPIPPPSGSGTGISACSTTPPTTGTAGSFCSTPAGLYQCQNGGSACTTAAQWALIGPEVRGLLTVTRTSPTQLAVGAGCSLVTPCKVRVGTTVYTLTDTALVTISDGTGTAYIWIDTSGVINVGHNLTVACARSVCSSATGFPDLDAFPAWTWTATSGIWDATGGTDWTAMYTIDEPILPGDGVLIVSTTGSLTIAADETVLPRKFAVTAAPGAISGNLAGDLAWWHDATHDNLYECSAAADTAAPACSAVVTAGGGSAGWILVNGGGGSMTWPGSPGIAIYSGSGAWGTSLTAPSGTTVGTTDQQTLTNKTLTNPSLGAGSGMTISIPNAGATGTTQYKTAKLTGAPSTAVIGSTSDTSGIVGIVVGGAGTTGSAEVARAGEAARAFDGATTAGHYVQLSSSVNGDCTDAGATYPTSGQVLGFVLSTIGSAGNATVLLRPDIQATTGGGGGSITVNGSGSGTNLSNTTPAAGTGYTNVTFQISGANMSAEIQRQLTATFLLCAGGCYAGETTNWKWSAPFALTFTGCVIDAATYPTGAAVTVDLLKGGTTTIFSSTVPTLAGGSSVYSTDTGMAANAAFTQGQYLIASVLTAGSTVAGQFVNLVCTATY